MAFIGTPEGPLAESKKAKGDRKLMLDMIAREEEKAKTDKTMVGQLRNLESTFAQSVGTLKSIKTVIGELRRDVKDGDEETHEILRSVEEQIMEQNEAEEASAEERAEEKRAGKRAEKEEKEQTETLKDIAKNVKPKKEKDEGMGWKKLIGLLGGIAALNIPLSWAKAGSMLENAAKTVANTARTNPLGTAAAITVGGAGAVATVKTVKTLTPNWIKKILGQDEASKTKRQEAKTAKLNTKASASLDKFHLERETQRLKNIKEGIKNAKTFDASAREAAKIIPERKYYPGTSQQQARKFGTDTPLKGTKATPIVKGQVIGDPTKGTAAVRVPKTPPKLTVLQQLQKLKDPASKAWNKFQNHPYTKMTKGMAGGTLRLAAKIAIPAIMLKELFRAAKDPNTKSLEHAFKLSAAKGVEWLMYNPLIEHDAKKRGVKGNLTQKDIMKSWNKNKEGLSTPTDKSLEEGRPSANPNVRPVEKTFKKFKETDIGKKVLAKEKQARTGEVDKKTWNQTQLDLMKHEDFRGYAYNDSLGIPTIGYGFNLTKPHAEKLLKKAGIGLTVQQLISKKGAITKAQGLKLLNVDQGTAQKDAWHFMGGGGNFAQLDPKAQSVIWNMAFNMGRSRLMKFGGLQSALLAGNYQSAADEMLYRNPSKGDFTKTPYALQTKGRAQELADQMRSIQSSTPNSSGKVLDNLNQSRVGSGGGGVGSGGTQVNIGGDTNMGQETVIPGPGVTNPKHGGVSTYNANPSFGVK